MPYKFRVLICSCVKRSALFLLSPRLKFLLSLKQPLLDNTNTVIGLSGSAIEIKHTDIQFDCSLENGFMIHITKCENTIGSTSNILEQLKKQIKVKKTKSRSSKSTSYKEGTDQGCSMLQPITKETVESLQYDINRRDAGKLLGSEIPFFMREHKGGGLLVTNRFSLHESTVTLTMDDIQEGMESEIYKKLESSLVNKP